MERKLGCNSRIEQLLKSKDEENILLGLTLGTYKELAYLLPLFKRDVIISNEIWKVVINRFKDPCPNNNWILSILKLKEIGEI